MPDGLPVHQALGVAAGTAAGVLLLLCRPWAPPGRWRQAAAWGPGVAVAFLLGCGVLGSWPRWPPRGDQERLLTLLLPAVAAVELTAGRLAWELRLLVAAAAAPILLHGTVYLTDVAGPGTRLWTPLQASLWLVGLATALAAVWGALVPLARRPPGRSVLVVLALAGAGAGVTVMYSGYFTGGLLGLPLAAALAGACLASLALPEPQDPAAAVGVGVVGLFAL